MKTGLVKNLNLNISLVIAALFIFFEYYFLGERSYVRIGDHLDSFLPRNQAYHNSEIKNWIENIQQGIFSITLREFYFPSILFNFVDYNYIVIVNYLILTIVFL